jgi:hypothetical protein
MEEELDKENAEYLLEILRSQLFLYFCRFFNDISNIEFTYRRIAG